MEKYATTTVGVDISDSKSQLCALDGDGELIEDTKFPSTQKGVERVFAQRQPSLVVLEVGTHSPWMSKQIESYGHTVLVANARMLPLIYRSDDKTDRTDAEKLARIARMDPKLLKPLKHRSGERQDVLAEIHARDALVRSRTLLVNHVRGSIKATGERLRSTAAKGFHRIKGEIPERRRAALDPVMAVIETLTQQIRVLEKQIEIHCTERFPESWALRQVPGVGPITALAFITSIEDPTRFKRNRDVGAYVGLRPRKDDSGERSPQLSITKAGNPYVRRLLVGSAQYILGPFGPDTDLRSWGLALCARGGKNAKKRAVVAVARKLSVLLLALWKSQAAYRPLKDTSTTSEATNIVCKGVAA